MSRQSLTAPTSDFRKNPHKHSKFLVMRLPPSVRPLSLPAPWTSLLREINGAVSSSSSSSSSSSPPFFFLLPYIAQCHCEQRCLSPDSTIHPALNDTLFPEIWLRTEVISPRILGLDTTWKRVGSLTLAAVGTDICEFQRRSELCG